ncbi:MAG: TetR/AcrR family transcriptional regulator [Eubacterium sp.]|nr:TetR/AcrR family transcriptional regulator [Eubacterium sp.]MBR1674239.1 TetR/AcrR family transcriptional regulator [Eubacterium sp.]
MNDKFYALPEEKRNKIINAGFRVFSRNSYRKSPMNEIAAEAGISKSLLFFYFRNKKEFFLFLWENVKNITIEYLTRSDVYKETDIFEMIIKGLQIKLEMMHKFPDMGRFALKAYYDEDDEIKDELRAIVEPFQQLSTNQMIPELDPAQFKEGLDLEMMYKDMYLASEGFLYHEMQKEDFDVDKMAAEFEKMVDFWRKLYHR